MEKILKILILLFTFVFIFQDTAQIKDNDIIYSIGKNDDTWNLNFKNKNYFGEGKIVNISPSHLRVKSKISNQEIIFILKLDLINAKKLKFFQYNTLVRFKANLNALNIKKLTIEGVLLKVFIINYDKIS